jgi:hypothetical protein
VLPLSIVKRARNVRAADDERERISLGIQFEWQQSRALFVVVPVNVAGVCDHLTTPKCACVVRMTDTPASTPSNGRCLRTVGPTGPRPFSSEVCG